MGQFLSKDINQWNADPNNRSKVTQVQQNMNVAMDQFNKNMTATIDRGQSIEEGVKKSEDLSEHSITLKQTSKKVNRTMCWRKYMVYIIGLVAILALIGIIILIVKIW